MKHYAIITLCGVLILTQACKKQDQDKAPVDYQKTIPQIPVEETQAPVNTTPVNNGGIIYIPINKVLQYNSFITIDADNNGENDLYFASVLAMYNDVGHLYLLASGTSRSGSRIALKNDEEPWSLNVQWVDPLDAGTSIHAATLPQDIWQTYMIKGALLDVPETTNKPVGPWVNKDKYAGIMLRIDGKSHYGWVRISAANESKMTVIDMAYDTVPGELIKAGQTAK